MPSTSEHDMSGGYGLFRRLTRLTIRTRGTQYLKIRPREKTKLVVGK